MKVQRVIEREYVTSTAISVELELPEAKLIEAFRRLPSGRQSDLLNKLQRLRKPVLRTSPANRLYELTGVVSLGGDATLDTEALYDGSDGH